MLKVEKLVIVSHVRHYQFEGKVYAYTPYMKEIEIWADLFASIVIAAPCWNTDPPQDARPCSRSNVRVEPIPETGGRTILSKLHQLVMLPCVLFCLCRSMRKADAIHVRCPGNLGLLGAILARLFSPCRIAKYAGQWPDYPGEYWTVRLQKSLLRSRWWGAPVTVYGQWPGQPPHIIPFFTSIMTNDEMQMASGMASAREEKSNSVRLLYVGRLSAAKNVDTLVAAINRLAQMNIPVQCSIIGDGPQRQRLEALIESDQAKAAIVFRGALDYREVLDEYACCDVLVLMSETEGWPKAITEAMAFGLICIGSNRGLVPQILGEGRGLLLEPGDVEGLTKYLKEIIDHPEKYQEMRTKAAAWSRQFTLENLGDALKELMENKWGVKLINHGGTETQS